MPQTSDGSLLRAFVATAALLAACALPAVASPWTQLHFSTGTSFNHTIAVGDLNGDSKLDVATPNSAGPAVTVFLGNGDGTLGPFASWATFAEPQDVVMRDLTGDGLADLATADYSSGGVTLLRGLGDGTFNPRVLLPAGYGLISLVPARLDGDTLIDLAITKESTHKLVVLPGLAGGTFGAPVERSTGSFPHQIGAADFDHDGNVDLAATNYGAGVASVHLGNGSLTPGAAVPYGAGTNPVGLTLADFNGDLDIDMAVTGVGGNTVTVLLGNGDGTFAAGTPYPTDAQPRGMDAGDLDGDGVPELVIATGYPSGDSLLTLYRGVGDGTFVILDHLRLPYRAADCVIADMNADGWNDIVATGPQAGVVTVLLNPGGNVGVPGAAPHLAALELAVWPNPVRTEATLSFRAPAGTRAKIEIFDGAGRRVANLGGGEAPSGSGTLTWRAGRAKPGLYFARLSAGGAMTTKRLVLLPQ